MKTTKSNPFTAKRQKNKDIPNVLEIILDVFLAICEFVFDIFN